MSEPISVKFKTSCPKCGIMESVQYSKDTNEEASKVIPGLPMPTKTSKEMFSLSFNHFDHTMIVNFYEDAMIHSVETIQRIDRSLQSLAIKPADKLMELASNVTEGNHHMIIISEDETLSRILSQVTGIVLRNLPDYLSMNVIKDGEKTKIEIGNITIHLFHAVESLKGYKMIDGSNSIFVIDSRSRIDINGLEEMNPQNVIVLVSKLEDLTDSTNMLLQDLIQRITPTSFLPISDLKQSVTSITSTFLFMEQLIMVGRQ